MADRVLSRSRAPGRPGRSLQLGREWSGQQLGAGEWALDSAKEESKGRQATEVRYVCCCTRPDNGVRMCWGVAVFSVAAGRFILQLDAGHDDCCSDAAVRDAL